MLKRLDDLAPSEWIANGRTPMPTEPYNPVKVSNCLPSAFPAYCKLFHPIYVDPAISDLSVSWHQREGAVHPSVGVKNGGTLVRESSHGKVKSDRIRWRQLALRYGLRFNPEITDNSFTRVFPDKSWPRLLGPDEGTLDPEICAALILALAQSTGDQPCFFYYSGMSVICILVARNREWCVCTDWDFSFTLVGGSQAVINAVASHSFLETLPVTPMSSVDYRADELNGSPKLTT